MNTKVRTATILAALCALPASSFANTMVIGNGLAGDCSREALQGRSDRRTLDICDLALETSMMPREDFAKTYVNRGVVHLRRKDYDKAERDFASAERLAGGLPEVFINRGAVRIRQHRFQEALSEIEKGIALKPSEMEKAYYNRAVAREGLADFKGAYLDFKKASELKPDWEDPRTQMARFEVTTAPVRN